MILIRIQRGNVRVFAQTKHFLFASAPFRLFLDIISCT